RLDAGARRTPPATGRARLRALRPRRLAGIAAGGGGDRRRTGPGHARARRATGALSRRAGLACVGAGHAIRRRNGRRPPDPRRRAARMKRFASLYRQLDGITGNLARLAALRAYFEAAPPEDAAWAVYFLAGG